MSNDLNLNDIEYQSQLRSKPVRENFTDIENNFNLLRSEVYASIAATASEVTSARDNFGNLSDNIHVRKVYDNDFNAYSYCTGSTAGLFVNVNKGSGIINGVGVEWATAISATLTAPGAGDHRVDVVVANTDNSISIVAGTATASANDPQFPSIASTQEQIGAVYLTAGTSTINKHTQIFNILPGNDMPDHFISKATTLYQGRYNFNNLIINNAITLDYTGTGAKASYQRQIGVIECKGNLHTTSSASFVSAGSQSIYRNGNSGDNGVANGAGGSGGAVGLRDNIFQNLSSGLGGFGADGGGSGSGSGGGGGASILYAGGDGGASDSTTSGGSGGTPSTNIEMALMFISYANISFYSDITLTGDNGGDGAAGSAGGAGGSAGGNVLINCKGALDINCTINVSGGDGGDAAGADGGGGGGGASGGIVLKYKTLTDNLTATVNGGSAGSGAGGGSNGSAGSNGAALKLIYNDLSSNLSDAWNIGEMF